MARGFGMEQGDARDEQIDVRICARYANGSGSNSVRAPITVEKVRC